MKPKLRHSRHFSTYYIVIFFSCYFLNLLYDLIFFLACIVVIKAFILLRKSLGVFMGLTKISSLNSYDFS